MPEISRTARLCMLFLLLALGTQNVTATNSGSQDCEPITSANIADAKLIHTMNVRDVLAQKWSPDGRTLAIATARGVHVLDISDFSSREIGLDPDATILHAAFNNDAKLLVFADREIYLLDLASGGQTVLPGLILALGDHVPIAFAFNSDGTELAVAANDGMVYIWDVNSDILIRQSRVGTQYIGEDLFYNLDGSKLISSGPQSVGLLDSNSLELLNAYDPSANSVPPVVSDASLTPDGSYLVILDVIPDTGDATLVFLAMEDFDELRNHAKSMLVHYMYGSSFIVSPDGMLLIAGTENDLMVLRLDTPMGLFSEARPVATLVGQPSGPSHISFSPDMRYIASFSEVSASKIP